jgi:hypothetical protein
MPGGASGSSTLSAALIVVSNGYSSNTAYVASAAPTHDQLVGDVVPTKGRLCPEHDREQ